MTAIELFLLFLCLVNMVWIFVHCKRSNRRVDNMHLEHCANIDAMQKVRWDFLKERRDWENLVNAQDMKNISTKIKIDQHSKQLFKIEQNLGIEY